MTVLHVFAMAYAVYGLTTDDVSHGVQTMVDSGGVSTGRQLGSMNDQRLVSADDNQGTDLAPAATTEGDVSKRKLELVQKVSYWESCARKVADKLSGPGIILRQNGASTNITIRVVFPNHLRRHGIADCDRALKGCGEDTTLVMYDSHFRTVFKNIVVEAEQELATMTCKANVKFEQIVRANIVKQEVDSSYRFHSGYGACPMSKAVLHKLKIENSASLDGAPEVSNDVLIWGSIIAAAVLVAVIVITYFCVRKKGDESRNVNDNNVHKPEYPSVHDLNSYPPGSEVYPPGSGVFSPPQNYHSGLGSLKPTESMVAQAASAPHKKNATKPTQSDTRRYRATRRAVGSRHQNRRKL